MTSTRRARKALGAALAAPPRAGAPFCRCLGPLTGNTGRTYRISRLKNQARSPAGQRYYAVDRSTNTNCPTLECPVGTPEAYPVCSIPKSTHSTQQRTPTGGTDSVSRSLLTWSTNPIARFLRVFYTLARFLRVFYTLDCPTNQYPFSLGRGGREQITWWCIAPYLHNSKNNGNEETPFCVMSRNQRSDWHLTQSGG
jgi:hypothetical protein